VIGDPSHEEHENMLEWLGGRFDPERFNAKAVKVDDPGKRWAVAFGKFVWNRHRGALRAPRRR
jgi:hypothetical protein